jgi:hypothetical protein
MRAQVATFAGCPMPSQFGRRQAPKKQRQNIYYHKFLTLNPSQTLGLFIFIATLKVVRLDSNMYVLVHKCEF